MLRKRSEEDAGERQGGPPATSPSSPAVMDARGVPASNCRLQFENGFFGFCEESYRVISAGFFHVFPRKKFMKMMLQRNGISWLSKKNKKREQESNVKRGKLGKGRRRTCMRAVTGR